jgi:hypothetical protein
MPSINPACQGINLSFDYHPVGEAGKQPGESILGTESHREWMGICRMGIVVLGMIGGQTNWIALVAQPIQVTDGSMYCRLLTCIKTLSTL